MDRISFGGILGQTVTVWIGNARNYVLLTALFLSPFLLYSAWRAFGLDYVLVFGDFELFGLRPSPGHKVISQAFFNFLGGLPVATVALSVLAASSKRKTRRVSFTRTFKAGLPRVFPVLLASLAVVLTVFAVMFVGVLLSVVPLLRIYPVIVASIVVAFLGLMFFLALPVATVENPGVFQSLVRSKLLTSGYKWTVLGLVVVILLAQTFMLKGVVWLGAVIGHTRFVPLTTMVVQTFFFSFLAVLSMVVYYEIRSREENLTAEAMGREMLGKGKKS